MTLAGKITGTTLETRGGLGKGQPLLPLCSLILFSLVSQAGGGSHSGKHHASSELEMSIRGMEVGFGKVS